MKTIHRTAVFTLHQPGSHVETILWHTFKYYTAAYTELLHACAKRYTVDELRGMATFGISETTGKRRMSARNLSKKLYDDPEIRRCLKGVCIPLENRLAQSVKEHVAQSLLGFVALYDRWDADHTVGGKPAFPHRYRLHEVNQIRTKALEEITYCLDVLPQRLNRYLADIQRTQQAKFVSVPFVGVAAEYGMGLYLETEKRRFFARLDIVGSQSRFGRPITRKGRFTDIKSGEIFEAGTKPSEEGVSVFGRTKKSVLVPLAMGRFQESTLRLTHSAFLPQRHVDPRNPEAAVPVSGKLVYRQKGDRSRVELHVSFAMPAPEVSGEPVNEDERPLLAINRGMRSLFAAVVVDSQAKEVLETAEASGATLLAVQKALEARRRIMQQRGASLSKSDRRQSQIAVHHIRSCANQIVELAVKFGAQVLMEDLASFASGYAVRTTKFEVRPAARGRALRTLMNRRQFEALLQAVDQRLELVGLPHVQLVSPSYISKTCPRCGHRSSENHHPEDARLFQCESCGMSADVDRVAAANVARKYGWLRVRRLEKKAEVPEDKRTSWDNFAARATLQSLSLEHLPEELASLEHHD